MLLDNDGNVVNNISMDNTYILKIHCKQQQIDTVTNILGLAPSRNEFSYWEFILIEKESDPYIDFVNKFLDLLEGKYEQLSKIGVERDGIEVWALYKYDQQCNLEFSPEQMKRLGEHGITFCISCWQSSEETYDE
jgi:hypothetical protein